jgi:hypothetical protein
MFIGNYKTNLIKNGAAMTVHYLSASKDHGSIDQGADRFAKSWPFGLTNPAISIRDS